MRTRISVLWLLLMVLCSVVASAQFVIVSQDEPITTQAPQLKIVMLNQDPDPVRPGQMVEVRFKVENKAQDTTDDLEVEILLSAPFSLYSGTALRNLGLVRGAQSGRDAFIVTWKLKVDGAAAEGEHDMQVRYRLKSQSWIRSDEYEYTIEVRDSTPSVIVKEARWNPTEASPGKPISLQLTLENKGQSAVSNVKTSLDLTGSPLSPSGASNIQYISRIEAGKAEAVVFGFIALPDAKAKTYNLPLSLSYDDRQGIQRNTSAVLGVTIGILPEVDVFVQQNKLGFVGETGSIVMQVVNKGLANVRFVTLELKEGSFEILSPKSLYLGDIDSDDFETAEFKLHTRNEQLPLSFLLKYTDSSNNKVEHEVKQDLTLYTAQTAISLGLQRQARNGWYITAGIVLAGIAVYLVIRRAARRRA